MIKLIIGLRGSGKTKTLVNMVNSAADASNGDVICIEFGNKLNYDIKPQARLVDSTAYSINNATALYGFIAGILASNYDMAEFEKCTLLLDSLAADRCEIVMTVSAATDEIPHALQKFI